MKNNPESFEKYVSISVRRTRQRSPSRWRSGLPRSISTLIPGQLRQARAAGTENIWLDMEVKSIGCFNHLDWYCDIAVGLDLDKCLDDAERRGLRKGLEGDSLIIGRPILDLHLGHRRLANPSNSEQM